MTFKGKTTKQKVDRVTGKAKSGDPLVPSKKLMDALRKRRQQKKKTLRAGSN